MKISFCTTCKGRLGHVRQTLPRNLQDNADYPDAEFILLNYDSPDGLEDWVRAEMMAHIESGRLVYAKTTGCLRFLTSHAKNVAHRVADGDVLCNVDADNFTGRGFANYIAEFFSTRRNAFLHSFSQHGTSGRIACRRDDFEHLGGYDEALNLGWGYDDSDLTLRMKAAGLCEQQIDPRFCSALQHSDKERVTFTETGDKELSSKTNQRISERNIAAKRWIANCDKHWGAASLTKNFSTHIEL